MQFYCLEAAVKKIATEYNFIKNSKVRINNNNCVIYPEVD